MTSYVDFKRELGYYQDPSAVFDFAQCELSRFSEIRHSYYPWEFTLFVYDKPKPLPFAPPPVAWPVRRNSPANVPSSLGKEAIENLAASLRIGQRHVFRR